MDIAPKAFGGFSGDLLVGNFGDGSIDAFDPTTGKFLGQLLGSDGDPLQIDGLWALTNGTGSSGTDPNAVYFTAGGVAEQHGIFGSLSVLDNMLVAQVCHADRLSLWRPARTAEAQLQAEHVLRRFRLLDERHRLVSELPGGMRKLLDIALAMVGEPKLLLLDEPTSGVAAEEKFPMMDTVMQALSDQPLTTLFVEHDMDIVSRYCSRVIAFNSGKVLADDVPEVALADAQVQLHVTGETGAIKHA